MANTDLDIVVRVKGATRGAFETMRKGLRDVDQQARKADMGFKGLYREVAKLAATLGAGIFLKNTISTFTQFDDTMRQVGAVTGATANEMEKLTAIAKEMGATTRFSASESADGLRLLGMAGFEAAEAIEALPGVLNLAAAGSLDLGTAADIATNVLAGFGYEIEELGKVNDVLVKTFTSSNTTLSELGEGFKLVGPIAKGLGADFEDLVGALGNLGNAGLKGTLAGTALRGSLNALFNPTKEETELMANLSKRIGGVGLQIKDSQGNFIGFAKIIEQLEKAGLKGDEALKLFGLRAGPGMAALLQVGSNELFKFTTELKNANGTASDIAESMEAGIGGATREMKAALENVQITLADAFSEYLLDALRSTKDLFNDMSSAIKDIQQNGKLDEWANRVVKAMGDLYNIVSFLLKTLHDIHNILSVLLPQMFNFEEKMKGIAFALDALSKAIDRAEGKTGDQAGAFFEINKVTGEVIRSYRQLAKEAGILDSSMGDLDVGRGVVENAKKVSDDVKKAIKDIINNTSIEAQLKASLITIEQALKSEAAKIEGEYDRGLINLDQYYEQRKSIIKRQIEAELELLKQSASNLTDPDKKAIANAKILALQEELNTKLIQLANERYIEEEKIEKKLESKREELSRKQIAAEKAIADQRARLAVMDQGSGLEGTFQKEFADMQAKQDAELQRLQDFHATQLDLLKEQKASELEVEKLHEQQKTQIQQQAELQRREKEKLSTDQQFRLQQKRLTDFATLTSSISELVLSVYNATGQKNKELFYVAKGIAIAEATINLALAISKAMSQKGAYSWGDVAAITAKGAALMAAITSASYAEGGLIGGSSPSSKADDKLVRVTSKEFIQPVDTTKYYGADAMEVIRRKGVRRDYLRQALGLDLRNFSMPSSRNRSGFASGGMIGTGAAAAGNFNFRVELQNDSGQALEAREGDSYFDRGASEFVIGVIIDAQTRNVNGYRQNTGVR